MFLSTLEPKYQVLLPELSVKLGSGDVINLVDLVAGGLSQQIVLLVVVEQCEDLVLRYFGLNEDAEAELGEGVLFTHPVKSVPLDFGVDDQCVLDALVGLGLELTLAADEEVAEGTLAVVAQVVVVEVGHVALAADEGLVVAP